MIEDWTSLKEADGVGNELQRFNVVVAAGRGGKLLPQLTNKYVDYLELGLVHSAVQMIKKHFLCQGRALAKREKFKNAVFLTR